jgi:3-deoxy-D-manno-octulosonate 8-phosphate phosphatase (KDO 8-P phosphatase)
MVTDKPVKDEKRISNAELRARVVKTKLVITDCDGVLTDAGVYYSANGEELKRFNLRDGHGFQRLREDGLTVIILTGENSPIVTARAKKLEVDAFLGVRDKRSFLTKLLSERRLSASEVAYIGDDLNDLPAMVVLRDEGLLGCPRDASPEIAAIAHFMTETEGGHGAFREFAEWILAARHEATSRKPSVPSERSESHSDLRKGVTS